jgi:hypothetical protein
MLEVGAAIDFGIVIKSIRFRSILSVVGLCWLHRSFLEMVLRGEWYWRKTGPQ